MSHRNGAAPARRAGADGRNGGGLLRTARANVIKFPIARQLKPASSDIPT
jgi:hypothetical protein